SIQKKGNLTPKRRLEIAMALGLETYNELITQKNWTLERVIFEVRKFAEELGEPNLMPMQKDLLTYGRQDLRGAITRFGGQSKVAELAGLTYQGQMVGPDGTRTYWTDQKIGEFLHEVATKEGHPGIMPTQAEVRNHAPNPDTITTILTRSVNPTQPTRSWF